MQWKKMTNRFNRNCIWNFSKHSMKRKLKTQEARANYVSAKFAFITGLFGLGALQIGGVSFHWLLYFIPLVAIGYDLYIRAEDLSIKKIGTFLRSDPQAQTAESEKAWERFSAQYRDKLAQLATSLFTFIILIAAAVYIYFQQSATQMGVFSRSFRVGFMIWFVVCFIGVAGLWISNRKQIQKLDGD